MKSTLLKHHVLIILALAIVLRLGILLAFPSVFAFDQNGTTHGSEAYDTYAQNLRETGVYGRVPGVPDAAIPPLYAYVLAGWYNVVGRGYLQVGLLHIALDLVTIACVIMVGRRLFGAHGQTVGLLGGFFTAAYPYLIFQNLTLIDTPLFMALFHGFVLALVLLRERPRFDRRTLGFAVLAGVLLGLATLTRSILPVFALLAAVWFLFRLSLTQTIARLLPVALVGAALLLPWIARNYQVYDTFIPMSITAGSNFYQGNNPDVIPYMRAGYDAQWTGPKRDEITADPQTPEGDRQRSALGWAYLNEHPEDIPELLWVKFLAHWSIDVFPARNPVAGQLPPLEYRGTAGINDQGGELELTVPEGDPVTAYSSSLFDTVGRTVHKLYFGGLLLLAVVGVVTSARYWREVSLLWFVQLSMTAVYVFFHPSTRYRVPSDPLLFLLSAWALAWLWSRLRGQKS